MTAVVTLSEVLEVFETGKRPKGGAVESGIPSLGGEHVSAEGTLKLDNMRYVPEPFFQEMKKGRLTINDILIVKDGATTGRVGIIEPSFPFVKAGINEHLFLLRTDTCRVAPMFLYFYLRSKQGQAQIMSDFRGAAQGGISREIGEKVRLPLPPLAEQRRLVDILSRAESIVRLRREAQKKAAELIPALFLDMFGDPATNPKGWAVASVGDVIAAADYGSSTKASDYGTGVPLIRMGNVDYAGYLKLDDLKHVELSLGDIERFGLREGDIIFNRTNSKELVGKTGIWDGSREAVAASYFIRVRVERSRINPLFFWAFMNSVYMKRLLFDTARGAIGQANINARELRAFQIIVPLLDLQNAYERYCRDVFSIQSQQDTAMRQVEATFDALLARTFGGL